jgi:hypothetical protein
LSWKLNSEDGGEWYMGEGHVETKAIHEGDPCETSLRGAPMRTRGKRELLDISEKNTIINGSLHL